jgi:hypothetical protein
MQEMKKLSLILALCLGLFSGCAATDDTGDTVGGTDALVDQDVPVDVPEAEDLTDAKDPADTVCAPVCGDKVCGDDGCGGLCGECEEGQTCGPDGACYAECAEPEWSTMVLKINAMAVNLDNAEGNALDIDGDPDTCAPAPCENGLNNSLGGLVAELDPMVAQMSDFESANAAIEAMVADGTITMLNEFVGFDGTTAPFVMNMYLGDAVADAATCDFQAATCDYTVKALSLDVATCEPVIAFDNCVVDAGKFSAGGPDYQFAITLPIPGVALPITAVAEMAQIYADATVVEGVITALDNGIVGGAVSKQALLDTVTDLPIDDLLAGLDPEIAALITKETILMIVDGSVVPDVDLDGDTEPDAASVAVSFGSIPGHIVGFSPEEIPVDETDVVEQGDTAEAMDIVDGDTAL